MFAVVKFYLSVMITFHSVTTSSSPPCRKFTIFSEFGENLTVIWREIVSYKIKVISHLVAVSAAVFFLYLKN